MSKTPSIKLFNLIKSLSGPEKRYFKLFARTNSSAKSSKYLQLFDAIDQQNEYDDEALIKTIYAGEKIQSRKYSELKAYLYELLLKALQGYDENSSIDFRLKRMLQSVQVLHRRSHYDDAIELLQKAKKTAAMYEAFDYGLEILHWEKQVAYAKSDIPFLDKNLTEIEKDEATCLHKLQNIAAYQNLFYRIMISVRKYAMLRSDEKIAKLEELMGDPLLQDKSQALSHKALIFYHRVYGLYYYSIIDYENFYTSNKKFLELLESNPRLLKESVADHISALGSLILSCGLLDKYDEINTHLDKLLKTKPITVNDTLKVHQYYYSNKLSLCIAIGDFQEGKEVLKQQQKDLKKFNEQEALRNTFLFKYFYIYFGIGDFDLALKHLNQWLNQPRSTKREDLQSLARILNLIIHYEMGNTFLLDYLFRSTYRFLKKRDRVFEFEKRVMRFIRDSNKVSNPKELKGLMEELREDFVILSQTPSEEVMFKYFDFLSWLESKINKMSFAEVLVKKYEQKINTK